MDMLNRIKSAVSSALPGNPLSKDFDTFTQVASGGPGLLWKIYGGVKRSTKQEASIFLFEKKMLDRYSRRDRERIIESLKQGVSQLTRLRHPKILSVLQPLEESREMLAFATEPVFASLANVLGNHDNIASPVPKELKEYELYEVEMRHGLLQVIEGLSFLHNHAKMMHHNLCPESVMLNKAGSWKLAGFDFCLLNKNPSEQVPVYEFIEWDGDSPPVCQPNLDYLAPEYAITMSCGPPSDMYSLGVLMYSLFNNGKPLFECHSQLSTFQKNAEELRNFRSTLLGSIPQELRDYVKLMLNIEPTVRPAPEQLGKISFFEDVGSMTLQYIDSLFQRENLEKSQFFKGLPKILTKLPTRVNQQRILPALFSECVNANMIPFVLPSILVVVEQSSDRDYVTAILPQLLPLFKIAEPFQISLIFLQNMNLLLSKTPQQDIKTHVLPMINQALESNNSQIQELCLNIIPTFAELVEYSSLKNSLIPRIKKLCLSTSVLAVRVNCLLCVGQMLEYMDKWFVIDEILPLLPTIPSKEPSVLMSILGIYKVSFSHEKLGLTKDFISNKILPFLIPVCIDNNLNLAQFNAYISLVKEMLGKVENEQRTKLEQLDQMKQEQKSIEISKITASPDPKSLVSVGEGDKPKSMMSQFLTGFGISGLLSTSSSPSSQPDPSPKPDGPPPASSSVAASFSHKSGLSLEEKQRLAKSQEDHKRLKSQAELKPKPTEAKPPPSQPKDLTSSLINSNLQNINSSSASYNMGGNSGSTSSYMGGNSGPTSSYMGSNSGPTSSYMGSSSGATLPFMGGNYNSASSYMSNSSLSTQGRTGFGASSPLHGHKPQASKSVDLSAFDNLLPSSNQPKKSLNELKGSQSSHSFSQRPQGIMGNQSMMGFQQNVGGTGSFQQSSHPFSQQGTLGSNQMMFAQQNVMTSQHNMMTSQHNMMTSQHNMMTSQHNVMTPQNFMMTQTNGGQNSSSSNSNDLADIFG